MSERKMDAVWYYFLKEKNSGEDFKGVCAEYASC